VQSALNDGSSRPESGLLDRTLAVVRRRSAELRARGFIHVAVFGSVARRQDGPDSDVDLLVEVGPGVDSIDALKAERLLAADLGREVQIVSRRGLDVVRHAEIFRDSVPVF
jgi:uncharacterized protein